MPSHRPPAPRFDASTSRQRCGRTGFKAAIPARTAHGSCANRRAIRPPAVWRLDDRSRRCVLNLQKFCDQAHFEQFTQFHRAFYRAVEATSVTPWAARALDRALAPLIVSALRHVDIRLTPNTAVGELENLPQTVAGVRAAILARAPDAEVAGGRDRLGELIDQIVAAWIETARDTADGGDRLVYAERKSPGRLLLNPLEAGLENLPKPHQMFVAGRSMRDVEPPVLLKVKSPEGQDITSAEDLE